MKRKNAPDYSAYKHQFSFYCYTPPNDGTWNEDLNRTPPIRGWAGEDFRTVERYKEYKDCGFDILLMQTAGKYQGEDWETSMAKRVMDRVVAGGIEKIIMTDLRLQWLSEGIVGVNEKGEPDPNSPTVVKLADENGDGVKMIIDLMGFGLVGEHSPFKTQEQVDEYVRFCMTPYMNCKGFYGVQLKDEPNFKHVTFYGDTYRAIKRVCPDAFVQYNLNQVYPFYPYFWGYPGWEGWNAKTIPESLYMYESQYREDRDENGNIQTYDESIESERLAKAAAEEQAKQKAKATETVEGYKRYGNYMREYIEHTGADYVMWDSYPLRGNGIRREYIPSMQVTADVCKEKGVKFYNVTQTSSEINGLTQDVVTRQVTEEGARWLNNMILGFGVKQIVYYTYFNKGNEFKGQRGTNYPDGSAFISRYGNRTKLYYFMQKIMAEDQKFAPTILNFDYVTSNVYWVENSTYPVAHVQEAQKDNVFQVLKNVAFDKECGLVTELYDKENDRYMYMAQNVVDPQYQDENARQTVTLDFGKDYENAALYKNGEREDVALENGKLTLTHNAGEATFVIPY
ncbi:MAG: hypothetical protein J6A63_01880 [Clostridia bacterium]|nr:hypothetical protein [Clostridia bacterium]